MAKNNVSVSELTKATETKDKSLIGDVDEIPATKKLSIYCTWPWEQQPEKQSQINFQNPICENKT